MYRFIVLLIGLFILSCDDIDPNQSPNPFYVVEGRNGVLETDTLYAVKDSVMYREDPNTYGTRKIAIGSYGDFSLVRRTGPECIERHLVTLSKTRAGCIE